MNYTSRQVEVANLLKGSPSEVVEEIVTMVGDAESKAVTEAALKDSEHTEALIRLQLLQETDWKKRAALCALLISRTLE